MTAMPHAGAMEAGWAALRRGAWHDARASFATILAHGDSAEAYDGLAWAAWWLDDVDTLFAARQRAYRLYRAGGDALAAAGVATWIASDHIDFRGDRAVASGWRRRAGRLLDGLDVARQHGWLAAHEAFTAILDDNDAVAGRQLGSTAAAIGRALGSAELEAVGMATEGLALVTQGHVADGMPLLDEAAAVALSGEFEELWAVTWTCCFLIYACERVQDLERAEQWCRKVEELSSGLGIDFAWGLCRAHHAGVLVWQGAWQEAERELGEAADSLGRSRPMWGVETTVRLGELRRRQGREHEANSLFRIAEPHPLALVGMAELALDRGDWAAAADFGDRILRNTPPASRTERVHGLQILVRAHAGMGDHGRSLTLLAELEAVAAVVPTPLVRATASFCAGIVAASQSDLEVARRRFEDAVDLYARAGVPYEEARARLHLAATNRASGRDDAAADQAERAAQVFVRLGAPREAERATTLTGRPDGRRTHRGLSHPRLTGREQQVLEFVARGMTDAEIGASLGVSRHTVHRHVANILTKLGCSSRAAAVAIAATRGIPAVPTG